VSVGEGGRLTVAGGTVLTPDGPREVDVVVEGGLVSALERVSDRDLEHDRRGDAVVDAAGCLVAPGFVDLQCNGAVGVDLASRPEGIWEVSVALPRWGVTAWLPTVVTSVPGTVDRALDALAAGPPAGAGPMARPLGLHLEGPYLAPERRGAHAEALLRAPSVGEVDRWRPEEGVVLVTLAPELPGALDLIAVLVERGVVVSAGHSAATAAQAAAAVDAGVTWVTHLFNGMSPLHHREPGLAGVALADRRLRAGVIADGIHLHPVTVAAAHRALGTRLTLVTDAVGALGMAPGEVALGSARVRVDDDGSVRLPDGTLAGSNLAMDQAVRNLAAWTGCPPADAIAAATSTPAAVLGRADVGAITVGQPADLVVLDDSLAVVATITAGHPAPGH
jgi:N-acetylglucosamine-6-phosphate deacetylase